MTPVPAGESLRAAAFDLAPEPALVVGEGGQVVAANEAAERLFGQSLGVMTRSGLGAVTAPDSPLVVLVARARAEGGPVRERGFEVSLFGQSAFRADGSAAPLDDGSVLLTLTVRSGALSGERGGAESAGLRTIIGLGGVARLVSQIAQGKPGQGRIWHAGQQGFIALPRLGLAAQPFKP